MTTLCLTQQMCTAVRAQEFYSEDLCCSPEIIIATKTATGKLFKFQFYVECSQTLYLYTYAIANFLSKLQKIQDKINRHVCEK